MQRSPLLLDLAGKSVRHFRLRSRYIRLGIKRLRGNSPIKPTGHGTQEI